MTYNTNLLVGLTGPKRVGKSTVAKIFENKYQCARLNFKDELLKELKANFKELLQELTLVHDGPLDDFDWLFEHKPPLVRALLQNYGTDVRRKDRENYWVEKWSLNYANNYYPKNVVVDDVRFLNEAEMIKQYGGVIIRLERDDIDTTDKHKSETEMRSIQPDYIIKCKHGDFECLENDVEDIVAKVMHSITINNEQGTGIM